jgi:actin-like ATPase involved in cell morphogenesis
LENSSPAVLSDLEHFPIVLSGGSSSLAGFPELISKMTGFRVTIAANPIHGAVKGLSIIRDSPKEYSYLLSQA